MNDFVIKDSKVSGKGLFTTIPFQANSILFKFDGKIIKSADPKTVNSRFLQIGSQTYLDIEKHMGVFCNHSCNPNCYVKIAVNSVFLLTSRAISAGDELFYDYSLTSNETTDSFSMSCNCDPFGCRKTITGFNSLSEKQKARLISLGMVPKYVI